MVNFFFSSLSFTVLAHDTVPPEVLSEQATPVERETAKNHSEPSACDEASAGKKGTP